MGMFLFPHIPSPNKRAPARPGQRFAAGTRFPLLPGGLVLLAALILTQTEAFVPEKRPPSSSSSSPPLQTRRGSLGCWLAC